MDPLKTPVHLHRREGAGSVAALLVLSTRASDALAVCEQLADDKFPPVYRVAGGFLIKTRAGCPACSVERMPPVVRLRALGEDLFLPVHAELVPSLLDDEVRALVRERGLVFLPGDRVLAYDAHSPLRASDLVRTNTPDRRGWKPFPEPDKLADRLEQISLDRPTTTVEQILEPGGEDIGKETPRPPRTGPAGQVTGWIGANAGKALHWMGNKLRMKWLAGLGASLIGKAMQAAPRLAESLLGRQEAALRQLLKDFREGRLDQALRRALPLGDGSGRGGAASDDELPRHSLRYSLGELLGDSNRPASHWFGGGDVMAQLVEEYKKVAEQAVRQGDHRRAAYIYAKLLRDYRKAADILSQGGLHRDAAVLYLDKLGDELSAARSFEQAGEFDLALKLYRGRGNHLAAGHLLRKLGLDEEALREYELASDQLADKKEFRRAGDLLMTYSGRPDLALPYYLEGWNQRPHGECQTCLLCIAEYYDKEGRHDDALAAVREAYAYYTESTDARAAAACFNDLVLIANQSSSAELRDEVSDLARLTVAHHLRRGTAQFTRGLTLISELMGRASVWTAEVVSDAEHAFKASLSKAKDGKPNQRPA